MKGFDVMNVSNENNQKTISLPITLIATREIEALKAQFENDMADGHTQFIIDASNLGFINYSALGLLVGMLKKAKEKGGDLWIRNLHGWPLHLFEESGLKSVFTLELKKDIFQAREELMAGLDIPETKLEYETIDDIGVFHLSGEIRNTDAMKRLKQEILIILLEKRKFILDFEKLLFMPSLAIDEIIRIHRMLKISGAQMRFCNPNGIVKELLTDLNLNVIIPIYPSLNEALSNW